MCIRLFSHKNFGLRAPKSVAQYQFGRSIAQKHPFFGWTFSQKWQKYKRECACAWKRFVWKIYDRCGILGTKVYTRAARAWGNNNLSVAILKIWKSQNFEFSNFNISMQKLQNGAPNLIPRTGFRRARAKSFMWTSSEVFAKFTPPPFRPFFWKK